MILKIKKCQRVAFAVFLFVILIAMAACETRRSEGAEVSDIAISVGEHVSFAILPDGNLWAWGSNGFNQLKHREFSSQHYPTKIMENVSAVSAGHSHVLAIRGDNSLWAWGDNRFGQLGNGVSLCLVEAFIEGFSEPFKVMDEVVSISAGAFHSLALRADGSLWVWGSGLGVGNENQYSPIKIMSGVSAISAGRSHSLAIKEDGSLWAWGDNSSGQLGDGTNQSHATPVKIAEDVISISAGMEKSMAIKSDGSLWVWGTNLFGLISPNVIRTLYSPVKIMESVVAISAGAVHSYAIKNDESLWVIGADSDFDWSAKFATIDQHTPHQILDNVLLVDTVNSSHWTTHTIVVKSDGSIWAWGDNSAGQIGDRTIADRNIPTLIIE